MKAPVARPSLAFAVVLCVLAVVAGGGSAWWSVRHAAQWGTAAGPWRVSLMAGSVDADLKTRARIAVGGLLALNRDETMYYVAATDSAGRALRSRCSYRISGQPPAARWWSLTAYADDFLLFDDAQHRYSINSATAALDGEGRFTAYAGPSSPATGAPAVTPGGGRWLPTPGDCGLVLTLRVYNPAPALQAAPASLAPPRIDLLGSCA
jgi:hypothetical protein